MDNVSPKGTKFILEIELTKDCVVLESCIGRSIYSNSEEKQKIEDTFKIVRLVVGDTESRKQELIDKIGEMIKKHII